MRPQNQGQNRFLPFQVNGVEMGGCVREYGGTGVFLPRVAATVVKKKQSKCVVFFIIFCGFMIFFFFFVFWFWKLQKGKLFVNLA